MKYIIADKRFPIPAAEKLIQIGKVLWLEPHKTAYREISGHPDIYITQCGDTLIVVPDISSQFLQQLKNFRIPFNVGKKETGFQYPETSSYNALIDEICLIHNLKYTDPSILDACIHLKQIHVNQGYTRCNCISLGKTSYITSDKGIEKTLLHHGFEVLYIDPSEIILEGFSHGFIGGCCGIFDKTLLVCGNPDYMKDGKSFRDFVLKQDISIVELYDGPMVDTGSIIIV